MARVITRDDMISGDAPRRPDGSIEADRAGVARRLPFDWIDMVAWLAKTGPRDFNRKV